MNVSHVGLCKCTSGIERGSQHITACFYVASILICGVDIFKNQLYSQNGVFARAVSSGIANIRLYCVSQGIHPGSSGYERWQAYCNFRIQNRISRNQREVINRIFVASMGVCDDCRQCRFASGAGGGRYRHQKRELFVYFQNSFHLGKRLFRLYNTGPDRLGAVYAGAAAESDDAVTTFGFIKSDSFIYIRGCRIGHGFVIDTVRNFGLIQSFF